MRVRQIWLNEPLPRSGGSRIQHMLLEGLDADLSVYCLFDSIAEAQERHAH